MRDYGKIYTAFWESPTVANLSDDGKLLAVYLLTSKHSNLIGCYRLPAAYAGDDLNWPAEKVEMVFAETVAKGFANRCETSKWVYLPQYLKWNPLENPNQHKAADKLWAQVPVNVRFADLLPVKLKPFANPSETLSKPVAVAVAVEGTVLPEAAKSSGRRGKPRKVDTETLALFDRFWGEYPKKVAKPKALKAWTQITHTPQLTAAIIAGLERGKKSDQWRRDDGNYIPNPANWLKDKRWEDELVQAQTTQPRHSDRPQQVAV